MFKQLEDWREDRNIKAGSYNYRSQVSNVAEELFELMGYSSIEIDEHVLEKFMSEYFDGSREPYHEVKIDAHCDQIVFAVNAIEQLGYNARECIDETIKEINSRKQDPIQAREWHNNKPEGKWLKDKQQDSETLYTADYASCKRGE